MLDKAAIAGFKDQLFALQRQLKDLIATGAEAASPVELDQVRVKGRKESVKLFEILRPDARDTVGASWIDAWTEGLTAYRAASWDAARRAFREVLELRGDDAPARLMLERISGLSAETPDDWDGTWNFQEK